MGLERGCLIEGRWEVLTYRSRRLSRWTLKNPDRLLANFF